MKKLRCAIIGAGNDGQSFAGHLGVLGFPVSLWDVERQEVEDLKKTGGDEEIPHHRRAVLYCFTNSLVP